MTIQYDFRFEDGGIGDYLKFFTLVWQRCQEKSFDIKYIRNGIDIEKWVPLKDGTLQIDKDHVPSCLTFQSFDTIDSQSNYRLSPKQLYDCFSQSDIKIPTSEVFYFHQDVWSRVDNLKPCDNFIGVHLRLGDNFLETDPQQVLVKADTRNWNPEKLEQFFQECSDPIVFFCDNDSYKQSICKKQSHVLSTQASIGHTSLRNTTCQQTLDAIAEFALLTMSKKIVAGSSSGFSRMASLWPLQRIPYETIFRNDMQRHLDMFSTKIQSKEPFGLIRPSDGEYQIMTRDTVQGCDGWTYKDASKCLANDLREAIHKASSLENIYIGVPCNTCHLSWNCNSDTHHFQSQFDIPQKTQANVFMNSNYEAWKLVASQTQFVQIGPQTEPCKQVIDRLTIDAKLVDDWPAKKEAVTQQVLQYIKQFTNQTIFFSAGPLAKIFIPLCLQTWPFNQYIDVGSSISYLFGQSIRPQQRGLSNVACNFTPTYKNLIQNCVFWNEKQIQLQEYFLMSIAMFEDNRNYELGVLCQESFQDRIKELGRKYGFILHIQTLPCRNIMDAAAARLQFFNIREWYHFENVMQMDTDILIKKTISNFFALTNDRIITCSEATIEKPWFGGLFFTEEERATKKPGINSGILLFRNHESICNVFRSILDHVANQKEPWPQCYDQAFVSYGIYKAGLEDFCMNDLVQIPCEQEASMNPKQHVIHFAWPIGNAESKIIRMKQYLQNYLENIDWIEARKSIDLTGRTYQWNGGKVVFLANGVLKSSWAPGVYKAWGPLFICEWNNYKHAVHIQDNFLFSIRTFAQSVAYDMDLTRGLRL